MSTATKTFGGVKSVDKVIVLASLLQACAQKMVMRGRYVARMAYWTARHRSIATARWVIAFEGLS